MDMVYLNFFTTLIWFTCLEMPMLFLFNKNKSNPISINKIWLLNAYPFSRLSFSSQNGMMRRLIHNGWLSIN